MQGRLSHGTHTPSVPGCLLFLLVPNQKCLFFLLQVVPSAGHSSSDRYRKSRQGSCPYLSLYPSHCLLPFPCCWELGLDPPFPLKPPGFLWACLTWKVGKSLARHLLVKNKRQRRASELGILTRGTQSRALLDIPSPTRLPQGPQSPMPSPVSHRLYSSSPGGP